MRLKSYRLNRRFQRSNYHITHPSILFILGEGTQISLFYLLEEHICYPRQLWYKPDGTISFNLTYDDNEWKTLPYHINLRNLAPLQLYKEHLKISAVKYRHLQEIKQTIPSDAHSFYDNLSYI